MTALNYNKPSNDGAEQHESWTTALPDSFSLPTPLHHQSQTLQQVTMLNQLWTNSPGLPLPPRDTIALKSQSLQQECHQQHAVQYLSSRNRTSSHLLSKLSSSEFTEATTSSSISGSSRSRNVHNAAAAAAAAYTVSGSDAAALPDPRNHIITREDERVISRSDMAMVGLYPSEWDVNEEKMLTNKETSPRQFSRKKAKYRDFQQDDFEWLDSSSFSSLSSLDDLENLVVAQQETVTAQTLNDSDDGTQKDKSGLSSLTQALNEMSLAEREKALYDLHGISEHLPEQNADQLDAWLQEMDEHLLKHSQDHPGLAKAMQLNEQYVRQERIKFLRSDEYDPIKAAERMGFYFDMKYDYFCGKLSAHLNESAEDFSCIARDLTINDLTEDDLKHWRTGFYQVCREKDRAGRIVCIVFLPLCYRLKIPPESMVRVYLVMNTILTQNVEVQRSGNVHIAYAVGLGEDSVSFIGSDHFANSVVKAGRYAPLRGIAKHFCYDHDSLHSMFGKYAKPMATYNAVRFRSHFGSHAEVLYNLLTFGISTASLPISDAGAVDTEFHNRFIDSLLELQRRRGIELKKRMYFPSMKAVQKNRSVQRGMGKGQEEINDTDFSLNRLGVNSHDLTLAETLASDIGVPILALNPSDVILGRGIHAKSNVGNLRLKLLVEKYLEDYNGCDTSRSKKTAIVNRIMKEMQCAGSRFVFAIEDYLTASAREPFNETTYCRWFLAPEDKIRDKISHDFRNLRRAGMTSQLRTQAAAPSRDGLKRVIVDVDRAITPSTVGCASPSASQAKSSLSTGICDNDIVTPGDMDILLGRSNKKSNLGHSLLRKALHDHYDEYEMANQTKSGTLSHAAKTNIVQKILGRMDAARVRFLVRTSGGLWEPAPPEKVHDKITQDFRNLRFAKKRKTQQKKEEF